MQKLFIAGGVGCRGIYPVGDGVGVETGNGSRFIMAINGASSWSDDIKWSTEFRGGIASE
jgi:hypothetical protein